MDDELKNDLEQAGLVTPEDEGPDVSSVDPPSEERQDPSSLKNAQRKADIEHLYDYFSTSDPQAWDTVAVLEAQAKEKGWDTVRHRLTAEEKTVNTFDDQDLEDPNAARLEKLERQFAQLDAQRQAEDRDEAIQEGWESFCRDKKIDAELEKQLVNEMHRRPGLIQDALNQKTFRSRAHEVAGAFDLVYRALTREQVKEQAQREVKDEMAARRRAASASGTSRNAPPAPVAPTKESRREALIESIRQARSGTEVG